MKGFEKTGAKYSDEKVFQFFGRKLLLLNKCFKVTAKLDTCDIYDFLKFIKIEKKIEI